MTFFEYNIPNGKSYNQKVLESINFFFKIYAKKLCFSALTYKVFVTKDSKISRFAPQVESFLGFSHEAGRALTVELPR